MRLYTKLVMFALAPLFLVALASLGVAFYAFSGDLARSYERSARVEMAQRIEVVDNYFRERLRVLEVLANTPRLRGGEKENSLKYLEREETRLVNDFDGLYLNDLNGEVTGTHGVTFNVRDRPYFESVRSGHITFSDIIESRDTGRRSIVLLVPIHNAAGEHIGALGGAIPVDTVIQELNVRPLPDSGNLLLIDAAGTLLVENAVPPVVDDAISQTVRDRSRNLSVANDGRAGDYFYIVQKTDLLGWLVVIYRPRLAVYSTLITASFQTLLVFGLGMVGAMALAMATTRWIMAPLQDLRQQLQALGRGQRDVRLRTVSENELGQIARVFNTMARRLQEREDQLRSLTESMAEGFALCEPVTNKDGTVEDYTFLVVNPAFVAHLGVEMRKLVKHRASQAFGQSPPPFLDTFVAAIDANGPVSSTEQWEATGKYLHVSIVSPEAGVYSMLVLDITERHRSEEIRLEMERRLLHAQKLESLGVLAGGIAHDFNNLLMAAMGNLELAQFDLADDSPARLSIESAHAATRRAADLTRQMLAYSGRAQFIVDEVNLNDLVNENAQMFRTAIARNVTMSVNLSTDPVITRGDASQLQQVVMNLITNASEAIGEGSGEVTLSTGISECSEAYLKRSHTAQKPPPGTYVYFEVRDSGCGMDAETLDRLFEPFFTTKFTGRGLGMASVLGVVQGHGGAILVDSRVGEGTAMRVLFPAAQSQEVDPDDVPHSDPEHAYAGDGEPLVLVVDDDAMVLSLAPRILASIGYKAITAPGGAEALDILAEKGDDIDCVLLDLAMPGMSGLDTLRAMRATRPTIRVVICTGYADDEVQAGLANERLDGFLHKPYQMETLRTTLETAIGRSDLPEAMD